MIRSPAFLIFFFIALTALAAIGCAQAQPVPAPAAVPSASAEGVKLTDIGLFVATAVLAYATWILAKATEGLQKSAEKQTADFGKSLEISRSMADVTKGQLDLAKEQLRVATGQLEWANAERAKSLGDQLFEFDKILMAYPELQLELEALRTNGANFLASKPDEKFVRLKSFIYMHLNFFDEIVSTYQGQSGATVEYQDWCTYIIQKLQHPAFKAVMENEGKIFGDRIRQFFKHNHSEIYASNGSPWLW